MKRIQTSSSYSWLKKMISTASGEFVAFRPDTLMADADEALGFRAAFNYDTIDDF